MNHIVNWAGATLVAAMFFGVSHLAGQDLAAADQLAAMQAQAEATETRMQRAARALCVSEQGPGAQARWTPDGQLICKPASSK